MAAVVHVDSAIAAANKPRESGEAKCIATLEPPADSPVKYCQQSASTGPRITEYCHAAVITAKIVYVLLSSTHSQ